MVTTKSRPIPCDALLLRYLSWSTQMLLYSSLLPWWPSRLEIFFRCSQDVFCIYINFSLMNLFITFISEHGSVWRTRVSGHIKKIFRLDKHFWQENSNQDIKTKSSPIIEFPAPKLQGPSIILFGLIIFDGACLTLHICKFIQINFTAKNIILIYKAACLCVTVSPTLGLSVAMVGTNKRNGWD